MRNNWLYFASLSPLQGAPALICPAAIPTARSAMKQSVVSPLLWLTITFQPAFLASWAAFSASVMVPIWLIFSKRQLQLFRVIAFLTLSGFVHNKSSPTICAFTSFFSFAKLLESSSENG